MNINLFGSETSRSIELPDPKGNTPAVKEDTEYNRRFAFACLNDWKLINRFRQAGLATNDYWEMVKSELGIESRSEIAPEVYAILAAELDNARNDAAAFQRLANRIHEYLKTAERAPTEDSVPVAFAEPDEKLSTCFVLERDRRTGKDSLVFIGEYNESVRVLAQDTANTSRNSVRLYHDGAAAVVFNPETNGTCPF